MLTLVNLFWINQISLTEHMKNSHLISALGALISLGIVSSTVNAASSQGEDIPGISRQQQEKLDQLKDTASTQLMEAAEWLDSFFDDSRSIAEENQTRATVSLAAGYSKEDDFEFKPRFNLQLKLPRLSSKALLIIQGSDDEDFDIESNPINNPSEHENSKYEDLTVGLRHFLLEAEKYNLSADYGVSWDYLYGGFRFRSIHEYTGWQGRLTNRLRYYTDDGWENITTYDLESRRSKNWLFRSTSSLVLAEDPVGVPHSQYFKLYQVLSEHQVISYESGLFLNTEPDYRVTDVQFIIKLRKRFYRDWLVLEVTPRVTFPKENDYEINPGILIKLEGALGYKSDTDVYRKIFKGTGLADDK